MDEKMEVEQDTELNPRVALALNLADYIKISGMTQGEVAQKAGIAASSLSSYMTGARYPRPSQLQALAQALGTTASSLTDGRTPNTEQLGPVKEDLSAIMAVCRRLSPSQREAVLLFAEFVECGHEGLSVRVLRTPVNKV